MMWDQLQQSNNIHPFIILPTWYPVVVLETTGLKDELGPKKKSFFQAYSSKLHALEKNIKAGGLKYLLAHD